MAMLPTNLINNSIIGWGAFRLIAELDWGITMSKNNHDFGFIVTANRPFYPDVEYAKTLEEAKKIKERFIETYKEENGTEDCLVTIAAVKETTVIKTY